MAYLFHYGVLDFLELLKRRLIVKLPTVQVQNDSFPVLVVIVVHKPPEEAD